MWTIGGHVVRAIALVACTISIPLILSTKDDPCRKDENADPAACHRSLSDPWTIEGLVLAFHGLALVIQCYNMHARCCNRLDLKAMDLVAYSSITTSILLILLLVVRHPIRDLAPASINTMAAIAALVALLILVPLVVDCCSKGSSRDHPDDDSRIDPRANARVDILLSTPPIWTQTV